MPNLSAGAHGLIVSNFMPKEFVAIRAAFEAGDMATARVHQARVVEIMTLLRKFAKDHNTDFFGTLKDVMRVVGRKRLGFDVGPARTPLLALPEDKLPELEAALNSIGFFSW